MQKMNISSSACRWAETIIVKSPRSATSAYTMRFLAFARLSRELAGLDNGETVTLPSVEDPSLWANFDAARLKMARASQTRNPASRYGIGK
jgi:hypothetical protein